MKHADLFNVYDNSEPEYIKNISELIHPDIFNALDDLKSGKAELKVASNKLLLTHDQIKIYFLSNKEKQLRIHEIYHCVNDTNYDYLDYDHYDVSPFRVEKAVGYIHSQTDLSLHNMTIGSQIEPAYITLRPDGRCYKLYAISDENIPYKEWLDAIPNRFSVMWKEMVT